MAIILAVRTASASVGPSSGTPAAPLRLDRGEVVVGRGAGAHLLLPGLDVSRRHCTISGEGLDWRVVDSSTGGTFVNASRIAALHPLRHGDVIRVGETEIAVMIEQAGTAPAQARDGWGRPAGAAPAQGPWGTPAGQTQHPAVAGGAAGTDAASALLQAAGLSRAQVGVSDQQLGAVAGALLKAALDGIARLARDRRRAREDLGVASAAETSALSAAGSAQELLLRLLSAPPGEAAAQVNALCADIDAHQRAVLGAMQASLHHALDQFSPTSIKTSARGDAEAWKAYERAFDARDDGFVEVFSQALAKRYGETVRA